MTTSLVTRSCKRSSAPQAHVVVCPLCEHGPLACTCEGPARDAMDRLLSDTVPSYPAPRGWTHVDTSTEDGPTVECDPSTNMQGQVAWCIKASTLRPLPHKVWDRLTNAIATKRI